MIFFKGWCESKNIKVHLISFDGFVDNNIRYNKNEYKNISKWINTHELSHDHVDFPEMERLISELEIIELPKIEGTFASDGYHGDYHYSPNGHEQISNILFDIFKNKLGYE